MYKALIHLARVTFYVKEFDYSTEWLELSTDRYAAESFNSENLMDLEKYIDRELGVEIDWIRELYD